MKTEIVSLSAKNIHKDLPPWCLKSYCNNKGLDNIGVIEASVNDNINEITGKIFESKPDIAAFSCYIWNIDYVSKIGGMIKKLLPATKIVLGGPEVSFENDLCDYPFADYIIKGSGERAFFELLSGIQNNTVLSGSIIEGHNEDFNNFPSPYTDAYFESFKNNQIPSIQNRLIYYESSRGCPFSCSYCLSSAFRGLYYLPVERVKNDLTALIKKGAKCIKFTDRTFNADTTRAKTILEFIYSLNTDCVFHFEVAADLFSNELLAVIEKMPVGRIQFEIGIQSVSEQVLNAVNRKTDVNLALNNIKHLTSLCNCHIHVDLIAGMPHETLSTFSKAIDKCIECKPHKLQLGFLKMLKGTEIRKSKFCVYADFAPYEVYQTDTLKHSDFIKLRKIENLIERFYNSGAFESAINYAIKLFKSPYRFFEGFLNYCENKNINIKISMKNAYTVLLNFLTKYGDKKEAEHNIKLDCLSFDSKGMLPDEITPLRNKQAELLYKGQRENNAKLRIEFFEFENRHKLFVYENKNTVTNKFEVKDIFTKI